MNKVQILDKLQRNLIMRGLSPVRGATNITIAGFVVSCVDAVIQAPMGGIDGTSSPFLGMGVVAPGTIKIVPDGTKATIPAIFLDAASLIVLREVCGFANDVVVMDHDEVNVLATLTGSADLHMMGQ